MASEDKPLPHVAVDTAASLIAKEIFNLAWTLNDGRARDKGFRPWTYEGGPVDAGKQDYRDLAEKVYRIIAGSI